MASRVRRKTAPKRSFIEISSDSEDEIVSDKRIKLVDSDDDDVYPPEDSTLKIKKKNVKKRAPKSKANSSNAEAIKHPEITQTNAPCVENGSDTFRLNSRGRLWQVHELLAENENLDARTAKNIVNLFNDDNTIPFICRYRRDMISQDITPEKLRNIKSTYSEILNLKKRADAIVSQLQKDKHLTEEVRFNMLAAKSVEELEFLYSPYKPASKGSLADRAKKMGLEKPAEYILYGKSPPLNLQSIISKFNVEFESKEKLIEGICHIMSHIISKDSEVLEEIKRLQRIQRITLKCTKSKTTKQEECNEAFKYENYFNFENPIKYIKAHQILAINRGEKAKILSVKIVIPDGLKNSIRYYIRKKFLSQGVHYGLRTELFEKSFEECYTKKLQPYLSRQVRSDLNEVAKKASTEVFARNLKQLLLMSPLKGEKILGIDPGFSNGCKLALISETTEVLETAVIYPHAKFADPIECGEKLIQMLRKHNCRLIALGNGTACRETEFWLSKLYEQNILDRNHEKYSIVSEQGASVYSCSDVAKKEFPNMDVNLISAVI